MIFTKRQFLKGSIFLALASIFSVANDIIMKYVPTNALDTLFLRFLFANLTLLPFIKFRKSAMKNLTPSVVKSKLIIHTIRAILITIGMFLYIISLKKLSLLATIIINFSIPLWVVLFSRIFLKEHIRTRILAVSISLLGIIITCFDSMQHENGIFAIILLFSAFCFAILDIFNKYLINKSQSIISMLMGSNLGILLITAPFYSYKWPISLWPFIFLGINANLLLYFILKAWKTTEVSSLQSVKYIEFPLAIYFNYKIFHEQTSWALIIGFSFLIFGISLNIYKEIKRAK